LSTLCRGFGGRKEILSSRIRKKIERLLKRKSKELAFFYGYHLPNLKKL